MLIIETPKYKGVKVTSCIKAIKSREIKKHLKLKQRNKIDQIDNLYRTNGYLEKADMITVWKFFMNFVMRDFRYNNPDTKLLK